MKHALRTLAYSLLFGALLGACATSPTGRSQLQLFDDAQMVEMGATAFQEIQQQTPRSQDAAAQRYVDCVTRHITDTLPPAYARDNWEVVLFEDDSANAFALPGGKIGVNTGLLKVAKTPAQLATVIGHEIGHVIAEHGNERMSTTYATQAGLQVAQVLAGTQGGEQQQIAMAVLGLGAQVGILLPFSRTQESEADQIGLDAMARAGFDPRESVQLWQNMAQAGGGQGPEFLSTHPGHDTRIEGLQRRMEQALPLYEQARSQGRRPGCRL
ncbi:M48 family metallopeptidase [Alkalilimnicola sp. S0819]|uniref:M48 family metallopeptidase n=1 Tax=Alkalilimnicola sp. S0819 TaxID=2613922 RepID=UPI001261E511|nr:M48 family metallopeptidase [Alkalilimnicola sp. S0819]KAB7622776.1 M48 family metallopeptidase [Alkalilimnicola sp. S0819]MPQ17272.1 M48 family metalloprotease [Alkalilimnicola sp. S0819]